MKISPLFDRVVIEKIEQATITPGGLHIPDDARQPSQLCLVVEVGSGRNIDAPGAYAVRATLGSQPFIMGIEVDRPKMHVSKGDKILIGKYSGTEVELNGRTVFVVRGDEILAIVQDDEAEALIPDAPAADPAA